MPLLTLQLWLPAVGALLIGVLVPRQATRALKWSALGIALLALALSVAIWAGFDASNPTFQFEENRPWIRALSFSMNYHLAVDGISLLLVALTTFLMVPALLGSWNIEERLKEFLITMLVLETGMLGVFLA
ncbi:MAG: hypothetical protein HY321_03225, partial [Armatimonadetes bacterium]|nr:hypothetical protein [Armatimonadota bacterium]